MIKILKTKLSTTRIISNTHFDIKITRNIYKVNDLTKIRSIYPPSFKET